MLLDTVKFTIQGKKTIVKISINNQLYIFSDGNTFSFISTLIEAPEIFSLPASRLLLVRMRSAVFSCTEGIQVRGDFECCFLGVLLPPSIKVHSLAFPEQPGSLNKSAITLRRITMQVSPLPCLFNLEGASAATRRRSNFSFSSPHSQTASRYSKANATGINHTFKKSLRSNMTAFLISYSSPGFYLPFSFIFLP